MNNTLTGSLNEKQVEAVKYFDSPLLILAGAGSGKTRVLTRKIAYIIDELNESPYSIFAVTFTNKAANEMKERVDGLVDVPVRGLWIGTFHSMSVRMIKMYRRQAGLNSSFTIYDNADSKSLVKKIIREKNYERLNPRHVRRIISNLKNKMITPRQYRHMTENRIQEFIYDVYSAYEDYLSENNALDFDSLLLESYSILRDNKQFRKRLQHMFKYILVDEYQDTNKVQYELLKLLYSGDNHIAVVGDDDQSIYGFRGAEVKNILNFDNDFPGTKVVKLEQNYRSTEKILKAASTVIAHNMERKGKTLWSDLGKGEDVMLVRTADERREAQFVAEKVNAMRQTGVSLSEIAVLYRTNAQSRPIEEMFRKMDIPYTVIGGVKFFERKEVKDILAYLNILVNPDDEYSLLRIINVPRRGIGKKGIENLMEIKSQTGRTLYEIIINCSEYKDMIPARTYSGVENLAGILSQLAEFTEHAGMAVEKTVEKSGYRDFLNISGEIEAITRKENIQELINSAYEFAESSEDASLADYLDTVSLFTDMDNYSDEEKRVVVMTSHNAKGLEFDTVFITGMEEQLFPHINSYDKEGGMEEERRLFYVAITRARKNLFITYADMRNRFGTTNYNGPSRFLNELPVDGVKNAEKRRKKRKRPTLQFKKKRGGSSVFSVNDAVIHPHWGRGRVKGIKGRGDSTIVIIEFPGLGTKKVYLKYANLKRTV